MGLLAGCLHGSLLLKILVDGLDACSDVSNHLVLVLVPLPNTGYFCLFDLSLVIYLDSLVDSINLRANTLYLPLNHFLIFLQAFNIICLQLINLTILVLLT